MYPIKRKMVCFDILLAVPIQTKRQTLGNCLRLDHIRKHYSADSLGFQTIGRYMFFRLAVCDTDAVGVLRDLPCPFFCVWVKFLRSDTLLYSYTKATGSRIVPPRDSKLLKDMYWSAAKLERCYSISKQPLQLP